MRLTLFVLFIIIAIVLLEVPCRAQGDFWMQAYGPFGGLVQALAVDSGGTILAGAWKAGVFRSTDEGQFWSPASSGLGDLRISALASHPSGTWFAAVWGSSHLYRSTNLGISWSPSNNGLGLTLVAALACSDTSIFSGGYYGVYVSDDTGQSWTNISGALSGVQVTSLALETGGGIFAGTPRGVFYSTNRGATWEQRNSGLAADTSALNLAIAPGGEILMSTSRNLGIYKSTDHGLTWTKKSTGIPNGYNAELMISPAGHAFASIQHAGLSRSTDLGDSWLPVTNGLLQNDVRALSYSGQGALYAGEYGGGVSRSTDAGLSWVRGIQGMSATHVTALAHSANGQLFAATSGSGIHRSTDDGHMWSELNTGLSNVDARSVVVSSGNVVYAGTFGGGVFRSDDDGLTWSQKVSGMGNTEVYTFLTFGADTVLAGCRNTGIFRTTDRGENWVPSDSGFPTSVTVHCLTQFDGQKIAAGTSSVGVYITTDGGRYWQQSSSGLPSAAVRSICATSPTVLFAGTDGSGTFRSTDGGASWQLADASNENMTYAIASTSDGKLFVGGNNGVHLSTDNGGSWVDVITGLGYPSVYSLDISPSGTLVAGTEGNGAFYSTGPVSVRGHTSVALPLEPYLGYNYPNPFNPTTVVSYRLPAESHVKLVVYDLLGREVALLVNEKKTAGTHEVTFDGSGLASGVYLYRLTAGSFIQTRKMTIVK
jgi:photosystem II stability/assembly factor-like uncharacterized protein